MTHGTRCFFLLFMTVLFASLAPTQGLTAANPLEMHTEDERMVKWELSADSVTTLNDSEIMEARGNVYLRKGGEYLRADFARYYMSTKWVFLQGNVRVQMGKDTLDAEEAEFDLRSRVGWLKKGRIFMEGPHAYVAGDRIDKHWGEVYSFKNAKITTCDGDTPAWSITAEEAVVEIDGYARLTRSTFQVNDTPVALAPYFLFPTKTNRQSGLLTPEFGVNSRHGLFYSQPYFWAINEHSDLTVNGYFMDKRGLMAGAEYRIRPSADSMGWFRADWLSDRKRVTDDNDDYLPQDGKVRTNTSRFWLRGMYDTLLPDPDWRFKADIDYVSDQDFLTEFRTNRPGYIRSRQELFNLFHRDLQERNLNRKSGILLSRDWERATVSLFGQYSQDPSLGNGNSPYSSDDTVQRLPQVDAFLHKGRILPGIPLEADIRSQAAYMYRRNGTRGARYEVVPRLTLPVTSRYGSVIAQASAYQTLYNTEHPSHSGQPDRQGPREDNETRTVPEFSIASSSEVARVFPLNNAPLAVSNSTVGSTRWVSLRHSVQPRVEYAYRADVDQEDNPYYDEQDRLMPRTELVYSLTNVLTRKREGVVLRKDDTGAMQPVVEEGYFDLMRLRVEQSFDQRESTRNHARDRYERRPYSDVLADLTIGLTDYLDFTTRNYWSPYLSELTRHQSGLSVKLPEYGKFYAGVDLRKKIDEYTRHREQELRFFRLDAELNVYGPWSLGGSYRYDMNHKDNTEKMLRLAYTEQCYKLIGQVYVDRDQEEYQLLIVLTGLGD